MLKLGTGTEIMRNLLAFFLVSSFVGVIPVLLFKAIPVENKEILVYIIGQLSGMATMALGFYFINKVGQDALDTKRADNTGKLADAVTAAVNKAGDGPADVKIVNTKLDPVPAEDVAL
jgi:hypothetical protein